MRSALLALVLLGTFTGPARAQDDAVPDDELPIEVAPALRTYVDAPYPKAALEAGVEGTVQLLVELDETGAVTWVEVLEGLGYGLDEAAMDAVRQMTFTPARTAKGPVGVALPFAYAFTLPRPDDAPDAEDGELPILQGPSVLQDVVATYPPEAEAAGLEGTVTLLVTLDETGAVEDVVVSTPAGNGFDEAAVDAVRRMVFLPARTAEGPIGVVFEFAYSFTLEPEVPVEAVPAPVNLEGTIRQMGPRDPVVGALVKVEGADLSTTTDLDGRFALRGVPAGAYTLQVRHPDHVELDQDVEIVAGEVTTANLFLRANTYRTNEAVGYYERERQEVTRRTLTIEEVKRIPGTFGDPVKVIQTLPGAGRSPFGTGLLLIRGANPEDTAVYVDGVRLPIIYHLTGTTSVVSPDVVGAVDYLPGGYGTKWGRSLSGTVDVRTKDAFPDRKIVGAVDVLDAQLWYEGPVDAKENHQLAIGGRRSYIGDVLDAFVPLFTGNRGFSIKPTYWDYQVKYIPKLGPDDDLSVLVLGFQDTLTAITPDDFAQGSDPDAQGDFRLAYQFHTAILTYRHRFSERLELFFQPSIAYNVNQTGLGDSFRVFNRNVVASARAELRWRPHDAVEIVPGLDAIAGPYRFEFEAPLSFADLDDPLADRDPVGFDGFGSAYSPEPWLELRIRPLKDRDRWTLTPGVRYTNTTYLVNGDITGGVDVGATRIQGVDPRFATRFVAWEDDDSSVTVKASTGLYGQPPQFFEAFGFGTTVRLLPERSFNSSLGIEHRINQAISWELEGFYRSVDQVIIFNNAFSGAGTQPFANGGQGYAAGFELIVRHAPVGRFFGWISYTFSRSFRRDAPDDAWTRFDFDQPHIFSAQGGYNLPKDWGLSLQVQVVSGNPYTPLNAGIYDVDGDFYNGFSTGPSNSERLPTFVQTSFRVDKTWTFRVWQLELYLDLINALRGVNPEFTQYAYDFSESAFVRGLPFVPNLGLEFRIFP